MSSNRPGIREVAKAACVSVTTVSRVINGRPDVDEETRQQVWQAIRHLRYDVIRDPDMLTAITVLAPRSDCFTISYWQLVVAGILQETSHLSIPVLILQNASFSEALAYTREHTHLAASPASLSQAWQLSRIRTRCSATQPRR